MVVLVDLAHGHDYDRDTVSPFSTTQDTHDACETFVRRTNDFSQSECDERPNPNFNSFSAALGCYPVVSQIAHHLDLNSLHDLSLTCRQFRANLLQNRSQLVKQALRCHNEEVELGPRLANHYHAWRRETEVEWLGNGRITSGRVGRCARDMVGECRRCGIVVCRNCTIKPPPPISLAGRYRRLCRICIKSPLRKHTASLMYDNPTTFSSSAFERQPCACYETIHICGPCGNALRSADTTYMRGWTWRTRYSTYLGGLGTGIGEGNEGVECGKGDQCLAAKEVEKEIDCDADELADLKRQIEKVEREGRQRASTSYLMQEIEGIGGVVKKKVKKRVRVGQVVREYEDERDSGDYLWRERDGINRSWCSWCQRIVPAVKDSERDRRSLEPNGTYSSSSSARSE